ncbi:NAD(P)/FAD-dependent oxidoreductase [Persicimonas caeni]|uniref:NAD(P)/FAD-dependent oxidoreductase n=1 Tax=Persicimonas caeni TaxID=2292766 RepID=A0A4Y6Q337_PERCE|nr:NAD(P)/FAD-dependent oxidoreductase [Persicimonas caeni]QED36164.1 NAD(P)/FAD-dependent oxidoreductase [Persicimonas caeni]
MWDAIIIGGGAAGFYGAITCANALPRRARVLIVERARRVLQKVKISGGGRCNVTHDCFDPKRMATHYPRGNKALIGPLHRFGVRETVRWFTARGVELKTEADGRMFPTTDDSQTVIDCLQDAADRAGVELWTSAGVEAITPIDEGFELALRDGRTVRTRTVLLATGGTRSTSGASLARSLGHELIPPVPSLFTFHIDDPRIEGLQGLSVDHVEVEVVGEPLANDGPLLVTHWGMSGPAILKLSAWGARELHALDYTFDLQVNWLPGVDCEQRFHKLRADWGKRQVGSRSPFDQLPKRLWERLVDAAEIDPERRWAELSKKKSRALGRHLTRAEFSVTGKSTNKDEFVTCGGVPTDEVDMRTMESRITPGVYFAGELLDIDGVTGGFNFQNAWTTGHLAGQAMAEAAG